MVIVVPAPLVLTNEISDLRDRGNVHRASDTDPPVEIFDGGPTLVERERDVGADGSGTQTRR